MQNYVCWIYMLYGAHVVVLQLLSSFQRFLTPWTPIWQASLSSTISQRLLKVMSIALVSLSNNLIICWPLLILPSIFPSIRVFSNDLTLHIRWPKDWSFSFNISHSKEYLGPISFRIDWYGTHTQQDKNSRIKRETPRYFKKQQKHKSSCSKTEIQTKSMKSAMGKVFWQINSQGEIQIQQTYQKGFYGN